MAIQIFLVCRFKNGNASAGALKISERAQAFMPKETYQQLAKLDLLSVPFIYLSLGY